MPQPENTNYPTSFDDSDSLLGELDNRQIFTVATAIGIDDTLFVMEEDLSSVDLPTYVLFRGGEIAYVETVGGGGNKTFICSSLEDRGALGTQIQPHGVGELVVLGITSRHHLLLKAATIAAEQHQGLVGNDADKPANPDPGERYTALDTGKFYYCFTANVWTDATAFDHGDLEGLADDDHVQYHTDGRADTWHDAEPGDHQVGGDDHDHFSENEGAPAERMAGGLEENLPEDPVDAQCYYVTDLDGGTLFIGRDGGWEQITGVPSGGIVIMIGDCPIGWTEYDMTGRIPMGAAVAGATGGAATHVHTYDEHIQHYHIAPEVEFNTELDGEHRHTIRMTAGGPTGTVKMTPARPAQYVAYTDTCSSHTHQVTIPDFDLDSEGVEAPETEAASSIPAARKVVFCQKD